MANGILIVDKPDGWTSQDVAAKLRGVFHEKRVGHGGTLDPMATGVLPVFWGGAAKAVDMQERADKMYTATMLLGRRTDTGDVTGETLEQAAVPADIGLDAVAAVLPRFTGTQQQVPPMYSAVKVNGQPLYKAARAGKTVERTPRPVTLLRSRAKSARPALAGRMSPGRPSASAAASFATQRSR